MIDQCEVVPNVRTSTGKEIALAIGSAAALYFFYTFAILALNLFPPALPPMLWVVVSCLSTVGYILVIVYAARLLARLTLPMRSEIIFLAGALMLFLALNPLVWQAVALIRQGTDFWQLFASLTAPEGDSLLGTISPFFLVLTGTFFGRIVARLIRETSILLPVAIVSGMIDFWGVYWGFVNQMSESAPLAVSGLGSAATAIAEVPPTVTQQLSGPMAMLLHLSPPESIGIGDFVFLALFLTCAYRLAFSAGRAMWGIFTGLLLASFIMSLDGQMLFGHDIAISYLPGLVFICGGFLLFNLRAWKLSRQEWLMTGSIILVLGACIGTSIFFTERNKPEPDSLIEYTVPASTPHEVIIDAVTRIREADKLDAVPVSLTAVFLQEKHDMRLIRWEMLVLGRTANGTPEDAREFFVVGGLTKSNEWQVMRKSSSTPQNSLAALTKAIKGDDRTLIREARDLLPQAWSFIDDAAKYRALVKGSRLFAIQLFPEGGFVIDQNRKMVKRLQYAEGGLQPSDSTSR